MKVLGRRFFKAEWFWGIETDRWLRKIIIGKTLNFPCGLSQIGDIRADKDVYCKPDIIADVRAPEFHFKRGEFETVICDPPFSYWSFAKLYSWFPEVCHIANKRLIFRCPLIKLNLPKTKSKWKREYYVVTYQKTMTLNLFHVFTNMNQKLEQIG